jgi:hypothetical protein
MATARRAQPRFVGVGTTQYLSASPQKASLVTGGHAVAPTTAVKVELHDATAGQPLTATTLRAKMFAGASGSDRLTAFLQFNTGLHVSCGGGAGGGVAIFFAGSAGIPTPSGV